MTRERRRDEPHAQTRCGERGKRKNAGEVAEVAGGTRRLVRPPSGPAPPPPRIILLRVVTRGSARKDSLGDTLLFSITSYSLPHLSTHLFIYLTKQLHISDLRTAHGLVLDHQLLPFLEPL